MVILINIHIRIICPYVMPIIPGPGQYLHIHTSCEYMYHGLWCMYVTIKQPNAIERIYKWINEYILYIYNMCNYMHYFILMLICWIVDCFSCGCSGLLCVNKWIDGAYFKCILCSRTWKIVCIILIFLFYRIGCKN